MYVRILNGKEVDEGLHLLYRIYVQEQEWIPAPNNQSGVRIEKGATSDIYILTDDFVDRSIYFGLFVKDKMVGIHRIVKELEVQKYVDAIPHLKGKVNPDITKVYETNRTAIEKEYRGRGGYLLCLFTLQYCMAHGIDLVTTVSDGYPAMKCLVTKYFNFKEAGLDFKYHPDDPYACTLFYLNQENMHKVSVKCNL
jgi:hypothetical protein